MVRCLKHENIEHNFIYKSKILQESTFPPPPPPTPPKKETGKYILLYIIKFFETTKIMLYINITCYGGKSYKLKKQDKNMNMTQPKEYICTQMIC